MLLSTITLLALPLLSAAGPATPGRACGSSETPEHLTSMHLYLHENEHRDDNNLLSAKDFHPDVVHHKRSNPITIPTYFHVVTDEAGGSTSNAGYVTDKMLNNQLDYLNKNYQNTSIQFNLVAISRTINATWASAGDDDGMKKALRKGTYGTLNVYYQNHLVGTGSDAGQSILGVCTLPNQGITSSTSPSSYFHDGCNILSSTVTGGQLANYNLGGTTVHEVGHWNGLYHTFQGNTCDASNSGDFVSDTPQQQSATSGCPAKKDTCPSDSGLDPIHNFMDYSQDSCYEGFTAGQAARMVNLLNSYRLGK